MSPREQIHSRQIEVKRNRLAGYIFWVHYLDLGKLNDNLQRVFKVRNTHPLPLQLPTPPVEWIEPYAYLAEECGLEKDLSIAFEEIASFYSGSMNCPIK